jgi:hypothetical protein
LIFFYNNGFSFKAIFIEAVSASVLFMIYFIGFCWFSLFESALGQAQIPLTRIKFDGKHQNWKWPT